MDKRKLTEEMVQLARECPDEALQRSNVLIAELPNEAWPWSLRSHVQSIRGDIEAAIADIDRAILKRFDEPGSHCDRARYLIKKSDFNEAIASFSNAIKIGKDVDFLYHESLSRFMRAFCYCKIGDYKSAGDDLLLLDDDTSAWIDRLRSKAELLEACRVGYLD